MRESLSQLCESFIENKEKIRKEFAWGNAYLYPVCTAVFTDRRVSVDVKKMKYCQDILKSKTAMFSTFRGMSMYVTLAFMTLSDEPDVLFDRMLKVYDLLKKHFWSSDYLPVAATVIADSAEEYRYAQIAERTRTIYEMMSKEHPFLTSSEDSVFSAMLAMSELSNEQIIRECEKGYEILKGEFFYSNAVQSLSHVLALSEGTIESKCSASLALYNELKSKGYKYTTSYGLATLGVAALLPTDRKYIVNDIIDVDKFLSKQKGYGFFGLDSRQRLMHATMLVTSDYVGTEGSPELASVVSTLSLIAAQQAALCAAIAASSAANS